MYRDCPDYPEYNRLPDGPASIERCAAIVDKHITCDSTQGDLAFQDCATNFKPNAAKPDIIVQLQLCKKNIDHLYVGLGCLMIRLLYLPPLPC